MDTVREKQRESGDGSDVARLETRGPKKDIGVSSLEGYPYLIGLQSKASKGGIIWP